jgi:hypothetical protein
LPVARQTTIIHRENLPEQSMTDLTFTPYGLNIKSAPAGKPSLYAKTSSGRQVGAVYKNESGNGWYGLVSGSWFGNSVSDIYKTRKDAQDWLVAEVERQELQRSTNPDNAKYHLFSTSNGCRASTLLQILQIFDEHKKHIGIIADQNNQFSALLSTPFQKATQYHAYAGPGMDNKGLRDIHFLCSAQEPILEAMATFPKEIKLHETVFLPLHELSEGADAKFHPVSTVISWVAEKQEKTPQGRAPK